MVESQKNDSETTVPSRSTHLHCHRALHRLQCSICSTAWSTCFFYTLMFTGLLVACFPSPRTPGSMSNFLKYVLSEVSASWQMGSAVSSGGSIELSVSSMRQPLASAHRGVSCSPPATKTLPHAHSTFY